MNKKVKKAILIIICIILTGMICLLGLLSVGKMQFQDRLNKIRQPQLSNEERFYFGEPISENNSILWPDNLEITKNDHTYHFNQNQFILYFMGIDDDYPVTSKLSPDGGQADAHFLIFFDTKKKQIRILTLNRNTMTDIDIYDLNNQYGYTIPGQLCLQHAYGDGREDSCEKSLDALRRCMHQMPAHAYVSLNKGILGALNDALGGVRVIALEDIIFPEPETIIHKGDDILLKGSNAFYYLTHRYTDNFGSNNTRLERQKQYLHTMLEQLKNSVLRNPFKLCELYHLARKYMVTDLSLPELFYLGSLCMTYQIDTNINSIPGETKEENLYETFYPDKDVLEETILEYYYHY